MNRTHTLWSVAFFAATQLAACSDESAGGPGSRLGSSPGCSREQPEPSPRWAALVSGAEPR